MNAGQVKRIVKEWVDAEGCRYPGFQAAHLIGSLAFMADDAPFPHYLDADVGLVLTDAPTGPPLDIEIQGVMLEVGLINDQQYASVDTVLSSAGMAANLNADSILADPAGRLTALQKGVREEYCLRKWVQARCDEEKRDLESNLLWLPQMPDPSQAMNAFQGAVGIPLTGLVAVACLRPPTHRRAVVLMKELLEPQGFGDLHEGFLDLLGFQHLTRPQVLVYLADLAETFDRAVQVPSVSEGLNFKLKPHARPYLVDASLEMVECGYHREAMGWITAFLCTANSVIQAHGLPGEKAHFQSKVNRLITEAGWGDMQEYPARLRHARNLVDKMYAAVDRMIERNPEIRIS